MAAAVVGTPQSAVTASASTHTLTVTGVTAGNTLVAIAQCSTARTFAFTDDVDAGAWTNTINYTADTADGACGYRTNSAGGNVTVTCTLTGGARSITWSVYEVSGLTGTPADVTGSYNDTSSNTSHYCVDASGITTDAAGGFCVSSGYLVASTTSGVCAAGADHTAIVATNRFLQQYRVTTGALTGYRAPWSSPDALTTNAFVACFIAAASGGTALPVFLNLQRQFRN